MKQKANTGSVHIILIVALVLALFGALGFIFWQNFINKQSPKVPSHNASTVRVQQPEGQKQPKPQLSTIEMNDVFTPGLSFEYPLEWGINSQQSGPVPSQQDVYTMQTYNVVSGDKMVDATIQLVSGGGLGGACIPSDAGVLDVFNSQPAKSFPGMSYVEYSYVNKYQNNQWVVEQGLASTDVVKNVNAGSSACDVQFILFTTAPKLGGSHDPSVKLITGITKHGVTDMVGFATLDDAKTYLQSETAQKIKAVYLSIH